MLLKPYVAVVLLDDLEEQQPPFYHSIGVRNLVYTCHLCGSQWGKVLIFGKEGRVSFWQARETVCPTHPTALAGSLLQHPCRWGGLHLQPWEQGFGPLATQREMQLALTYNNQKELS